jgi:uncharacterized membrane protein YhaH (DUF805 family)
MDLGNLLFSFQGRINRAKYWLAQCIAWIIATVVGLVLATVLSSSQIAVGVALLTELSVVLISSIAIGVKRTHDRDKSGWWLLIFYLIPFWMIVELGFLRGTAGPNQYGPDPLDGAAAQPA